jgi:uncharacterized protein (DUF305 family)
MSDMILAKDGINSEITELAQQIKDAQAPEIAQMRGWLAGWGQNPSPSTGMDHDMGGTMTRPKWRRWSRLQATKPPGCS